MLPDDPRPHGYITQSTIDAMPWTRDFFVNYLAKQVQLLERRDSNLYYDSDQAIADMLHLARTNKVFKVLGGWRTEKYPVLGSMQPVVIERAAANLFGIITRGVHMTIYTMTASGMKIWVPRRSRTKSTYPGMLDNSVAGGLSMWDTPIQCLVREADEEASLDEELVLGKARACGTLSWLHVKDERSGGEAGLLQPGVQFVYDLEVDDKVVPKPNDDEVEAFHLWDIATVMENMASMKFKPSAAVVLVDFFIRHGFITAENEPDYVDIIARIHRKLPFPTSKPNDPVYTYIKSEMVEIPFR